MHLIDWLIPIPFIVALISIGLVLRKRATASVDEYFLAGRKLPWWLIGFANVASYTGSSAAFVLLVFEHGIVGNWMWWSVWVLWMPMMMILWAKLWRRLRIVTDAEFLELRYGGRFATFLRASIALYIAFIFAVFGMAIVSTWLSATISTVTGIAAWKVVLTFGLVAFAYTLISGIVGVAYTDVPQFLVYLIANCIFVPFCVGAAGGWSQMYQTVREVRGEEFLRPFPPAASIPVATMLAFFLQGFLTTASSSTAQRFAAAKNEFHAIMGQAVSLVMSLVVRIVPIIIVGIAAAALYPKDYKETGNLYGEMILRCAPAGLVGLLLVGELSGFMATLSTLMNWGASLFINDLYKRFIKRDGSDKHYVRAGQWATLLMVVMAMVISITFVKATEGFFLYLNSVIGAFAITSAAMRFMWWRFNKYAEFVGILGGFPLGAIIWFGLDYQHQPFWQGFGVLAVSGFVAMVLVALLTPPEDNEKLKSFYRRCLPFGFWGPIRRQVVLNEYAKSLMNYKADFLDVGISIVFSFSLVVSANSLLGLWFKTSLASFCICLSAGSWLLYRWKKRGFLAAMQREEIILGQGLEEHVGGDLAIAVKPTLALGVAKSD